MSFPDHPLTLALNEVRRGGKVKSAVDAMSLVQSLKELDNTAANAGAYDRLIDFLGSTTVMHQVNCAHEDLRKVGRVYRCANKKCGVVVLKEAR